MVCEGCGRCVQRVHWDAWECKACGKSYSLPHEIVPASAVTGDLGLGFEGHAISEDEILDSRIDCKVEQLGLWRIHRYKLGPGIIVAHFHANNIINRQLGGADERFCDMQEHGNGLERRVLQSSIASGTSTAHFSKNYGNPYKYVVGHAASTSFKDAPKPILEAVRRLTWAGKHVVPRDDTFMPFNELLAVGYFEDGSMGVCRIHRPLLQHPSLRG